MSTKVIKKKNWRELSLRVKVCLKAWPINNETTTLQKLMATEFNKASLLSEQHYNKDLYCKILILVIDSKSNLYFVDAIYGFIIKILPPKGISCIII